MKFAKVVFTGAGIWGIAVLLPLYWLVDISGRHYSVPTDYPQFFYGFFSVALAWQVGFLIIGSDPGRYRPLMIAGILEKLGYVATLAALFAAGRIPAIDTQPIWPDLVLGLLFIAAYFKTRGHADAAAQVTSRATTSALLPQR